MSSTKTPINVAFKSEVDTALATIAQKYGIGLESVGLALNFEGLIVVAKFHGEPMQSTTKRVGKGVMAFFEQA